MKVQIKTITTFILIGVLTAVITNGETSLTDPYEILKRHFEANGGLDRVKAEGAQYVEGTLEVAGLKGTLKAWTQKPDRSRADVDLGVLKITQGDNGEYQWILDSNGKLQKITKPDEATVKRREVRKRLAEFDYVNPDSKIFNVTFQGKEKVDDKECYVIKMTNSINNDIHTSYINADSYLLEKSISSEGDESKEAIYGDYRRVEGLMVAFWTKETALVTGQTQVLAVTKYVSNPKIESSIFEPPQEAAKDYHFVSGSSAENIPFRFVGDHIFIPVLLGCKERIWILDTGAGMSVISEEFAKELGLKLEGDLKGKAGGGTVNVRLTTLPPFSLKGIEFDGQTVAVIDMKDLNRAIGFECAGILGFDFLSRFVTKVDFAAQLLSFYDPETFRYTGDGREVIMHMKNSVFVVEATLDGTHSGSWLFDMGAAKTELDGAYAFRKGFRERKGFESIGRGAGGAFKTKLTQCETIQFAGYRIDKPIVAFPIANIDSSAKADEMGVLGNTLFRNFVIYCDYAHERLFVEKGDKFNQPHPRDNSGLQLILGEDGETEVLFVAAGTPAAAAGFQEGDVVKSINGIATEHLNGLNAIREMLAEKAGTEYRFAVDHQGQKKECKLKLADLF